MKRSSPSFDDLVFENRNKTYGAYELRQLTHRHSAYGLFITMSAFTAMILVGCLLSNRTTISQVLPPPIDVNPSVIDIIPQPPAPPVQTHHTPPPPPAPDITQIPDVIVPTNTTTDVPLPTQQDLANQPVVSSPAGTEGVHSILPGTEGTVTNTTSPSGDVAGTINYSTISNWAQVMPSFIGGEQALREYLAKRIKMHPVDIENGVSGKVIVRFFIDLDGSVKGATVIKDTAGGHCAEAAMEVIKKMPKWNPGMQNNSPVRVYYTMPITFEVK